MLGRRPVALIAVWTIAPVLGLTVAILAVALLGLWVAVGALAGLGTALVSGWLGQILFATDLDAAAGGPVAPKSSRDDLSQRGKTNAFSAATHGSDAHYEREAHMKSSAAGLINLLIVWGVASAAGFVAMAALMVMGDWTLLQGLFAAAVIFFALGTILSTAFLRPLPGPAKPGSAGFAHEDIGAKTPAATAKPAPAPAPAPEPERATQTKSEEPSGEASRPQALDAPREGGADDLKKIKGVGPKLEELVNSMGFYHFDQIANWTESEVAWVDENLEGFKGRVTRDGWVEQAKLLASGNDTEFSKRVDKGDVY